MKDAGREAVDEIRDESRNAARNIRDEKAASFEPPARAQSPGA